MSKEIYLHIQEPCHENWEGMSPVEQGRFCQSCAKQVIDFSRMSDSQILDILSKAAGNTCGRFTGNQLERPLVKGSKEVSFFLKPYKLVLSSLVPLLIISGNASGQDNITQGEVAACRKVVPVPRLMGAIALITPAPAQIKGRVVDEQGKGIKGAIILYKGTNTKAVSGAAGNFIMSLKQGEQKVTLQISYTGYKKKELATRSNTAKPLEIKLTPIETELSRFVPQQMVLAKDDKLQIPEIKPGKEAVTCVAAEALVGIVGGLSIVETVTVTDTLKTAVQKLFNNELFKAFPNPVNRGQTLHMRFKQEGDYSMQLFDNSGKLYMERQLKMAGKEMDFLFAMPASIGSGVYYLKAICVSANKQFIEKIVVP